MSQLVLTISLRPGVRALTAVVSVLHARAAHVAALTYCVGAGDASLLVRVEGSSDEADLLARQIRRRVDVTDVHVRERVSA